MFNHKLSYFLEVAKYENMTQAAKTLKVSQSAISQAIRDLEDQLQVPLFYRRGRRIFLTDQGRTFQAYCQSARNQLQVGQAIVKNQRSLQEGQLSLAITLPHVFPELIHDFLERYPGLTLSQYDLSHEAALHQLTHYQLDVAVTSGPVKAPELISQVLLEDELYLALAPSHPLLSKDQINRQDLEDLAFVGLHDHYAFRQQSDQFLADLGVHIHHQISVDDAASILRLTQTGRYASLITSISLQYPSQQLSYLPIQPGKTFRKLQLVYRSDTYPHPVLHAFLDFIGQWIQPKQTANNHQILDGHLDLH
ncbi:LysR family transcriptional regulator [Aerococcus sanguinicola]|uniref:LysR family transcriptional regulator n=1 Tax=Aerococcus sanguinicola TaxID=119206 RepID=UPI00210FF052|nr:LysR family transcriptional regulator [Aerococcus sanguinicola]MDK7050445.1 LysR family transcriptional regulator [Aerococcus sanguinicola]